MESHPRSPKRRRHPLLHLAGNLQYFIGAVLGGTVCLRDREGEFTRRELKREQLLAEIDATARAVDATLIHLSSEQLEGDYPIQVNECTLRTGDFLFHLLPHLSYHLGQIDYHRRSMTGRPDSVEAVAIAELL